MSIVLLTTGCTVVWQQDQGTMDHRSILSGNVKTITLTRELSASIYQILNRETPENAYAKQPHTMGDVISGKVICDNEFINSETNITQQKCRIIIDTTDRGEGG